MSRHRRVAAVGIAAAGALVAALVMPQAVATTGRPAAQDPKPGPAAGTSDVRNVGPDLNGGKQLPFAQGGLAAAKKQLAKQNKALAAGDHQVGDTLTWPALDDINGIYFKQYTLRGIGKNIQVWVADDRAFPGSDCRNTLGLTNITDAQVTSFINEFDTNIYPKESQSFSVPPPRDGTNAQLGDPDMYKVSADQADDITVLVDNVRDANYYDPSTPDGQTYIAGFFYSVFSNFVDRNVMTIDAYDWLHRTGANPPDNSTDPAYVACAQSQGQGRPYGAPRPRLYEGTFAHEYQHLLESYEDPDEATWVNEGLSDYAQSLVGYVDTSIPPTSDDADSHIASFAGFLGQSFGGPENSLTNWQDQGAPEILADYGAAYSFMMYLYDHYGESFMSALHREDAGGLVGLDKVLKQFKAKKNSRQTLHDWALTMAVDGALSGKRARVYGARIGDVTSKSLTGIINWDNPQAYDTPGAPPNGSDYVRFRDAKGRYLTIDKLRSISFKGSTTLAPDPVEWTVAANPPDATTADTTCGTIPTGTAGPALYSGCGSGLDRGIFRSVTVPAGTPTMTFKTLYDTEEGYDFGFVQVSTDGGKTYKSLPATDTTDQAADDADPTIAAMLPGFTGDSGTWKSETVDLSAYAGKSVLLGFRYKTDSGVDEAGWWVKDVTIGGTAVPTGLDGWKTPTQIAPTPVSGYTVQLLAYDAYGHAIVYRLPLDKKFAGRLGDARRSMAAASGGYPSVVAAAVMQDDQSETVQKEARYRLEVNGVLQPGG